MAITSPVKSRPLENANDQNLSSNLYNNLANIRREGNSNHLRRLNSVNNNLSNNLLNPENSNLLPNNIGREGNLNSYILENNNLQRNNLLQEMNSDDSNLLQNAYSNLRRQGVDRETSDLGV